MIIGINATFKLHGGAKTHLLEFIKWIRLLRPGYQLIIYTRKENLHELHKVDLIGVKLVTINGISKSNVIRVIWVQLVLPFTAIKMKNDILFCPGNMSPILNTVKKKVQWIGTIGPFCNEIYKDISFQMKLEFYFNKILILLSGLTSDVVIHSTGYSMHLFIDKYFFNKDKQYLINAGKEDYFSLKEGDLLKSEKYSNDMVVVSHLYRYKNIENLIYAYSEFISNSNANNKLHIIGSPINLKYYQYLLDLVRNLNLVDRVIFSGEMKKEDLREVYSSCKLFVFPSFCESSGYILIEAMSCGSPILASNRTAIPYTCSEAAIYFDPKDVSQLSLLMSRMMNEKYNLKERKEASLLQASKMPNYKESVEDFLSILENKGGL